MAQLTGYYFGTEGTLWIAEADGDTRRATEKEWLSLWKSDPRFTLALLHQLTH